MENLECFFYKIIVTNGRFSYNLHIVKVILFNTCYILV